MAALAVSRAGSCTATAAGAAGFFAGSAMAALAVSRAGSCTATAAGAAALFGAAEGSVFSIAAAGCLLSLCSGFSAGFKAAAGSAGFVSGTGCSATARMSGFLTGICAGFTASGFADSCVAFSTAACCAGAGAAGSFLRTLSSTASCFFGVAILTGATGSGGAGSLIIKK